MLTSRPSTAASLAGSRPRDGVAEARFWAAYLACGAFAAAVYVLHEGDLNQAVVGIGLWASALVAIAVGGALYRPSSTGGWLVLAAAATVATVRWVVRELQLHSSGSTEPGSLTDAFGLIAYALLIAALVLLLARREGPAGLFDAAMITVALGLVARLFLWDDYFDASPLGGMATATQLAYAAGDAVIAAVLVRLVLGGLDSTARWLLVSAAVATLASAAAYNWLTLGGEYMPGSPSDLGWIAAPALLGAAALHPSMRTVFERRPRAAPVLRSAYLAVLVPAAVAGPVLLLTQEGTEDVAAVAAIAAGASLLSLLALGRVVALVHEGTALRRRLIAQNQRLLALDGLKDTFLATASHELRTPLASIYGAALTLRERGHELDDAEANVLLGVISDQSDRLARTFGGIVEASSLDVERLGIAGGPCDAIAVARHVLADAEHHAPTHRFALEVAADVRAVRAEPAQVAQVLAKLVDNAAKYSPAGSLVVVRLEPSAIGVRISVSDEGIGIDEVDQELIFEKFSRVDPDMQRGVGGAGLGLYICREIVRLLGGRIWVRSSDGEGSTFAVELPAVEATSA